MNNPVTLPGIRNITVSGRIASGATTLARQIADTLGWEFLEGGTLFEQFFNAETGNDDDRPDGFDLAYEEKIQNLLRQKEHQVIQSHFAGFDAQGIAGVYKIGVLVEDEDGEDRTEVRIDRLVNRKNVSVVDGKKEIKSREEALLARGRRLYADNDPTWVYWDKKYFDIIVNTFSMNKDEALALVLEKMGYQKPA